MKVSALRNLLRDSSLKMDVKIRLGEDIKSAEAQGNSFVSYFCDDGENH